VIEKRSRTYPFRKKANQGYAVKNGSLVKVKKNSFRRDDRGGHGWEIAKEQKFCYNCFSQRNFK
jgi:hypothetical protein